MPSKSKARVEHEADIKAISEAIAEAIQEHSLCDEGVREFFENVNSKLNVPLEAPVQNGEVYLYVTIKVTDVPLEKGYFGDWVLPEDAVNAIGDAVYSAANDWVDGMGAGTLEYATIDDSDVNLW